MPFLNETGLLNTILGGAAHTITGDMVSTMLMVLMICIALSILFDMPLEFFAVIMLPMCIAVASYFSTFFIPLLVFLIYIAAVVAKNWLVR